jgi:hypothetical protein
MTCCLPLVAVCSLNYFHDSYYHRPEAPVCRAAFRQEKYDKEEHQESWPQQQANRTSTG